MGRSVVLCFCFWVIWPRFEISQDRTELVLTALGDILPPEADRWGLAFASPTCGRNKFWIECCHYS